MQEILNTFGVDWRLLVIQAANFGLMLLVLYYFLYSPLLRLIEERQKKIATGVRDAEKATEKLEAVENEKEGILQSATQSAEKIVSDAKERGVEKEREIIEEAQQKSERVLADATAKAAETKRQAIA